MLNVRSLIVLDAGFGPEDSEDLGFCCGLGLGALR